MRPVRLEIEGFTSFRDKTVVDFEDADLFVLTGPTGAGKSSVIDAITFALYGSVPRLDDRRAVAPVISQGALQARVRLDFSVAAKRYAAVRVARATKAGASTPEARLEDEVGNTLASSARELSDRIEGILGLSFEHFTKSVVLPQGDFAEFLHEKSSHRQDLLVKLLGIDLYERLARRAGQRRSTSEAVAGNLERDIEQLEANGITDDSLKAVRQRANDLDLLQKRIQGCQPEMEALRGKVRSAEQREADAQKRLDALRTVRVPGGVAELAKQVAKANRDLVDTKKAHDHAMEERRHRQDVLDELPQKADVRLTLRNYDDLAKAQTERDGAEADLAEAQEGLEAALAAANETQKAFATAEQAQRSIQDEHSAYHLASGLMAGGSCPVCRQHVSELPTLDAPKEMETVNTSLQVARTDREYADKELDKARPGVAVREQGLKDLECRVKNLEVELRDAPVRHELEKVLKQVEFAVEALREANASEKKARDRLVEAERVVKTLEGDKKQAWQEYGERRDRLAEMQPPAATGEDLAAAWDDLDCWAKKQVEGQIALHKEAEKERESAESSFGEHRESIAGWCRDGDVAVADGEDPLMACSREQGLQEAEVKRIQRGLEDLEQKHSELKRRRRDVEVAAELARHLGASNFERWLMAQVLNQLCVGASRELLKLSSGSYSLALDAGNNFLVVDHHNADERRPVKTLSGGETFLASLSLALSLSQHLTDLVVGGAGNLEALFLDEGFGTLDSDTLDIVVSAIEELGSSGRMVGVVTHVRELAESIPVRYEVTKQGNRSFIERVET